MNSIGKKKMETEFIEEWVFGFELWNKWIDQEISDSEIIKLLGPTMIAEDFVRECDQLAKHLCCIGSGKRIESTRKVCIGGLHQNTEKVPQNPVWGGNDQHWSQWWPQK